MKQRYQFFVSPNEILSVNSFGLTLFDITACVRWMLEGVYWSACPGLGFHQLFLYLYEYAVDPN